MEYEFEATAKPIEIDGETQIAAWTDGLSISCDVDSPLGPPAYKLVPGQKYRITIKLITE